MGLGLGIFSAFVPVLGLQIILAILLAMLLRGNMAAALLGTAFANPFTLPFIFALDYQLGLWLLSFFGGTSPIEGIDWKDFLTNFNMATDFFGLLKPLFLGGIVLGICAFGIFYGITFFVTKKLKQKRSQRFFKKKNRFIQDKNG